MSIREVRPKTRFSGAVPEHDTDCLVFAGVAEDLRQARVTGFLAKSITCSGQIIAIDQSLPNSSRTTSYFI